MKHFLFEPASNEIQVLTAGLVRIVQKSTPSFPCGSRLFSTSPAESGAGTSVEFDTSGKSPAYLHHCKNFLQLLDASAGPALRVRGSIPEEPL